ncbi:MAG: ABC transporter ATP-binding protein [Planctomycetota bacterium]
MALKAEGISKGYRLGKSRVEILSGVSLELAPRENLVIVGPSGCGKSSLLNILSLIDRPDGGRLLIDGEELGSAGEPRRRQVRSKDMGFVFQAFHLVEELSVLENAALPGRFKGLKGAVPSARDLLARLGLGERLHQSPPTLSGGERQRVAVARALLHKPRFLFADEPTGNLDPATGREVMALIRQSCAESGASLILVTHNPAHLESSDRVLNLEAVQRA